MWRDLAPMSILHQFAIYAATGVLITVGIVEVGWSREWTSKAGTTIEADLVRVHLDNAILKKKDGKELVVPIAKLSPADQTFLRNQISSLTVARASDSTIIKSLAGDLVRVAGGKLQKANLENPESLKYLAVYFSAHWCRPCRAFTPDLVEYYKRTKPEHPELELVFVSSDRSEEEWKNYIIEEEMPWYAVQFRKAGKSKLKEYGGSGIPCLVVMTPDGKVVSDSYVDGQYVGPRKVLADLQTILERDSSNLGTVGELSKVKP